MKLLTASNLNKMRILFSFHQVNITVTIRNIKIPVRLIKYYTPLIILYFIDPICPYL